MKKRLLAMILAFVMAMSLLPMSALAVDGTNQIVSNGKEETAPDSQERVKHSKIIRQTGENTFDITLEVKTKEEITALACNFVSDLPAETTVKQLSDNYLHCYGGSRMLSCE